MHRHQRLISHLDSSSRDEGKRLMRVALWIVIEVLVSGRSGFRHDIGDSVDKLIFV